MYFQGDHENIFQTKRVHTMNGVKVNGVVEKVGKDFFIIQSAHLSRERPSDCSKEGFIINSFFKHLHTGTKYVLAAKR